ncbi:MAG: hypothetical protein GXO37_04870 [Chloroflexi bacterium]|nr:hypothetical protein [Chloroflexota bacterium]
MSGGSEAVHSGRELRDRVVQLAASLGLEVQTEVPVGRRIYGKRRRIDIVVRKPHSDKILGIECKYQGRSGTAEEKIAIVLNDIDYWPIPGLVVIDGPGFSEEVRAYLLASGKVVEFQHLQEWLRLFFAL